MLLDTFSEVCNLQLLLIVFLTHFFFNFYEYFVTIIMVQAITSSLRAKITFTSIVKASLFVDYFSQFMDKTENKELNNFFWTVPFFQSLQPKRRDSNASSTQVFKLLGWHGIDDKRLLFESGHLKRLDNLEESQNSFRRYHKIFS